MELEVADDGMGITEEKLKGIEDSYGMQLISLFTQQIKGELSISNEKGTSYTSIVRGDDELESVSLESR